MQYTPTHSTHLGPLLRMDTLDLNCTKGSCAKCASFAARAPHKEFSRRNGPFPMVCRTVVSAGIAARAFLKDGVLAHNN